MSSSSDSSLGIPFLPNSDPIVDQLSEDEKTRLITDFLRDHSAMTLYMPTVISAGLNMVIVNHEDLRMVKEQVRSLLNAKEKRKYDDSVHERGVDARLLVATHELNSMQEELTQLKKSFSVIMPILSDISNGIIGPNMFGVPTPASSCPPFVASSSVVDSVPPGLGASATRSKRRKVNN